MGRRLAQLLELLRSAEGPLVVPPQCTAHGFEHGRCVLVQGHLGPHTLEGDVLTSDAPSEVW